MNNLTNSATQQEQFDSGNELEEAAFSSEDEDQDEAVDFVLAEIGSSSSEEGEESDENDYNNWRPSSITILCRILVCFFFFVQMSWIFACGLRFNRKSQPCIFFRWFALHFRVKTYAKNSRLQDASLVSLFGKTIGFFCLPRSTTDCKKRRRVFCVRFNWKMKRKPVEKNTGLWLSIKSETTCKNSAHLDEKKQRDQNST